MDIFLTIILVLFLIYYLCKLLFPVVLRSLFKRFTGISENQRRNNRQSTYKNGETTITSNNNIGSEVPKDFGEYTDFEEIKDTNSDN